MSDPISLLDHISTGHDIFGIIACNLLRLCRSEKELIKNADKKVLIKTSAQKEQIIAYLTDHPRAAAAELCELLDVKPTRVRNLLRELAAEDIVVADGGNRNRTYRLKA